MNHRWNRIHFQFLFSNVACGKLNQQNLWEKLKFWNIYLKKHVFSRWWGLHSRSLRLNFTYDKYSWFVREISTNYVYILSFCSVYILNSENKHIYFKHTKIYLVRHLPSFRNHSVYRKWSLHLFPFSKRFAALSRQIVLKKTPLIKMFI